MASTPSSRRPSGAGPVDSNTASGASSDSASSMSHASHAAPNRRTTSCTAVQDGSRPNDATSRSCGDASRGTATAGPTAPAPRYDSSQASHQPVVTSTSRGSSSRGAPIAAARSQVCTTWSASTCQAYSSAVKSPNDRWTVRAVAPGSASAATAAFPAVAAAASGAWPSRSPSSASPTSATVLPSSNGTTQRSSPTTWLTRARTSQSAHGVAAVQAESGTFRRRRGSPRRRGRRGRRPRGYRTSDLQEETSLSESMVRPKIPAVEGQNGRAGYGDAVTDTRRLVLASASPARLGLLRQAGLSPGRGRQRRRREHRDRAACRRGADPGGPQGDRRGGRPHRRARAGLRLGPRPGRRGAGQAGRRGRRGAALAPDARPDRRAAHRSLPDRHPHRPVRGRGRLDHRALRRAVRRGDRRVRGHRRAAARRRRLHHRRARGSLRRPASRATRTTWSGSRSPCCGGCSSRSAARCSSFAERLLRERVRPATRTTGRTA